MSQPITVTIEKRIDGDYEVVVWDDDARFVGRGPTSEEAVVDLLVEMFTTIREQSS